MGPRIVPLLCLLAVVPAFGAKLPIVLRDTKGHPIEDAVVSLLSAEPGAKTPAPLAQRVEIVQTGQQFSPYITVVTVGTAVTFPNKDTVQHHVYSLSKAKKFELPLYDPGKAETIVFDLPGVVTLGCNIHDWMLAYLVVLPTSCYARTDQTDAATLDAPAGAYRFEIWHPQLGWRRHHEGGDTRRG
jgi:plastocyanin